MDELINPTDGGIAAARPTDVIRVGALALSPAQRRAWLNGDALSFTRREFDVLVHLARHRNVVLSRRQIADAVWGHDMQGFRRIDTIITRLRSKLRQHDIPPPDLQTVAGLGYTLRHAV